jgi:hypothetical protein
MRAGFVYAALVHVAGRDDAHFERRHSDPTGADVLLERAFDE